MRKLESLINDVSNGYFCQSCENTKENLSFFPKELLAKSVFIKSLLSLSQSRNCNIQNEEENMENKADKDNNKINQYKQKQEKNMNKYI